jgi:hypothetical protein
MKLVIVLLVLGALAAGWLIGEAGGDQPKTLICTSSATYAPDEGEQQSKLVCKEG